ncbi:hypothetical protein EOD39_12063 [Acipenser ruthenus]|uniref:Uncharacterized protein n=1 Tax=Acipenser ruthenus TaxID=7906 RepID=A0A444UM47_ACIRT|nr:hypothetical protein EOD39_12063 [Acipenser ruthenus]
MRTDVRGETPTRTSNPNPTTIAPVTVGRTSFGAHLHLNCRIEGMPCTTLIDSETIQAKVAPMAVQLWTVTGQLAPAAATTGQDRLQPEVWVADIQDQCILGLNFLQQAGGQLDLERRTVSFRAGLPLLQDMSTTNPSTTVCVGTLVNASLFKGSCKGCEPKAENQQRAGAATAASTTSLPFPNRIPASTSLLLQRVWAKSRAQRGEKDSDSCPRSGNGRELPQ